MGFYYGYGRKELNYLKAKKFYEKGCVLEDYSACNNLANLYNNGLGIRKDHHKANKLYEQACNSKEAYACHNLGNAYLYGKGVKKNYSKAKELYSKACDLDDQMACNKYKEIEETKD